MDAPAHSLAVKSALQEFEVFAATRIRKNGAQNDRLTGKFAAARFTHDTSRALDPHLHMRPHGSRNFIARWSADCIPTSSGT
jgi:conjugative relaxase-like TrwC/TraI family protein